MDLLLDGLDDAQRQAVTTAVSPLRVLAGAGSGKTRVLTRRIAHRAATGDADPRRVLAITFTRKAAGELESRLRDLELRDDVTAGTFHAIAYGLLRRRWADRGIAPPAILDARHRLLRALAPRNAPLVDIEAEIDWAKARLVTAAEYAEAARSHRRRPPLGPEGMAAVYERYEADKRQKRLVDFDDLLWLCAQDLEDDEPYAAAVRWRYQHVFVDEFQDVNALQFRLLQAIRGASSDVCVVGDPNQAIYAWNGADARYLLDFPTWFPGCETVTLGGNYRSSPEILAVAGSVLSTVVGESPATSPEGPIPTLSSWADEREEAAAIAQALRDARRPGVPWHHHAVLVRTNAQVALIDRALASARVPARVRVARRTELDEPAEPEVVAEEPRIEATDAVEVATFHAAKGLEWPVVYVAGLEAGLVPIAHARSAAAEAEERRLLYVALTRAERELHCSWAARRQIGREVQAREASPYLAGIQAAIVRLTAAATPVEGAWRQHIAVDRDQLAVTGDPLLDELRSWRAHAARGADVSPTAILADHTLAALAADPPHDVAGVVDATGFGSMKAARFAEAILAVIAAHRERVQ